MRNLDIRVMVSESGIKYKEVAAQMGVSRQYLSLLMRYDLDHVHRERILRAIREIKASRLEAEEVGGLTEG